MAGVNSAEGLLLSARKLSPLFLLKLLVFDQEGDFKTETLCVSSYGSQQYLIQSASDKVGRDDSSFHVSP